MKKYLLISALALLCATLKAQAPLDTLFEKRLSELENKSRLKELVDTFSILADKKQAQSQTMLFTENATVETYQNSKLISKLSGRKEIGEAFERFLKNFETVYHFNGQYTVSITGNKAQGILYCMVYLINTENGKKMRTTIGVFYDDEYVFENGHWLISNRTSTFDWQDRNELFE
ncbi:MAG: nuclear transport factor 2 family protein [Bacteroidales bacterium]|nr:nuclear transport factor 2 family protein [Bacteroidales bacterium]HNW73477.1 nuclear transport factor 2 family protein [Bacteroidales bacterium]HPS51651.1 nuclear transport factor 2 family protein [Bacteroidales bacterium]